jgi:thiamine phosphate synthase YjbQ (UPF0047 family)
LLANTSPLAFTLTLTDGREIETLKDASLFFATLTPEQREASHWNIAIRMLGNALKQPTHLKAATISLQTALVIDALLASPMTVGGN